MTKPSYRESPSDHIVLCGFGRVGCRVFSLLRRLGEPVLVINLQAPEEFPDFSPGSYPLIVGDAREDRILRQAGIERAKAVIVATHDDMTNVAVALDVKRMNPDAVVVIRLFDQEVGVHLERTLGVRRTVSTSALAVPGFVGSALGDRILGSIRVGENLVVVERLPRPAGEDPPDNSDEIQDRVVIATEGDDRTSIDPLASDFDSGTVWETCLRILKQKKPGRRSKGQPDSRQGPGSRISQGLFSFRDWWREAPKALRAVLVSLLFVTLSSVALFHFVLKMSVVDSIYFALAIVTTTGFGDYNLMNAHPLMKLYGGFLMLCGAAVLATLFSIVSDMVTRTRFRDILARGSAKYKGHVIVVGLGNVGFRVLRELQHHGERVVAVEREEGSKFVPSARSLASVVIGSGRTDEILLKAGISGARALVAATDDDISNLGMGLMAKRLNPDCRTVLRVFDPTLAEKMHGSIGAEAVLSVSGGAAPSFVGAALGEGVMTGFSLPDKLIVLFDPRDRAGPPSGDRASLEAETNEFYLLLRKGKNGRVGFSPPVKRLDPGDAALGVRWYPLRDTGRPPC